MTTTKMNSGLAFNQERELRMFAEMAAKGKKLVGLGALGHGWRFVDAEPEQVVFDIAYEDEPSPDYFDIFAAAGWTHVFSAGNIHIFKAKPGTAPVHTALESKREELTRLRGRFAKASVVTALALVVVLLVLSRVTWPSAVEVVLVTVFIVPFVYSVFPLIGFQARLSK